MRTKETEIERNGSLVTVKLRALIQGEIEELENEFGINYDIKNKCAVGNIKGYMKKALPLSIVEPKDLGSREELNKLEGVYYKRLQKTFVEVNSEMKEEEKSFL